MGNGTLVSTNVYYVKEVYQIAIDDDTALKSFSSFFAADDFCCEQEDKGLNVYIESRTATDPVITGQDLDNAASLGWGFDPRQEFMTFDLPAVLYFIAAAIEVKAIAAEQHGLIQESFAYQEMLQEYIKTAEAIEF